MIKKHPLIILFFTLIVIRSILAFLTPLAADESYYLLWASHLDFSYVDHPGMVSWLNYLFIYIFREPLLAIRICSLSLFLGSTFFIYKTIKLFTKDRSILWNTLIFYILIPYNFLIAITMQVDQPMILFTAMSIYFFSKLLKTKNTLYFYGIGLTTGLGMLSKYTFILVPSFMFAYVLFNNQYRKTLLSKKFFLSFLLSGVLLTPLLLWNIQHEFISFLFHTNRIGESNGIQYVLEYIMDQLLYFSPVSLYFLIKAIRQEKKSEHRYFLYFGIFIFSVFFVLSFLTKVWGHWTATMFIPLAIFLGISLKATLRKVNRVMIGFNLLLIIMLLFSGPAIIPNYKAYRNNYNMKDSFSLVFKQEDSPIPIYADLHASVGHLSYYLQQDILFPEKEFKRKGVWGQKQFEIWNNTKINKGDSILYFTNPKPEIIEKLKQYFGSVHVYSKPKLVVMESYINKYRFILCSEARKPFEF